MKRAVSISIGSSKRDKAVEIDLLGEKVSIERIGTDGSMEKAAQIYRELDGKVDAFGVGGTDLGLTVGRRYYPLYSIQPMVRFIKQTPFVDGGGLRTCLESQIGQFLEDNLGSYIKEKKAMVTVGVDRWDVATSFVAAGYDCVFGDLMFALGVPIPLHKLSQLKTLAALMLPIFGRLPFELVYPTGEKQEVRTPKFEKYYQWATVIAGDCHYVKGHMPDRLEGKVIATNTTTPEDVALFRQVGIKYLVTSTPVLDGRSFGTNMMEAAMIAVAGKGRKLTGDELREMLGQLGFQPQLQELN
ncbi:MAG: quinate 5-dehydrogenase [Anaerolineales bacterium]|nr:quinate 5-dehydrogenase [Anaerolineae bacterium]PWB55779.1 MAG: quinate 5-dehydrogenase [Anaerolineales bacterium]